MKNKVIKFGGYVVVSLTLFLLVFSIAFAVDDAASFIDNLTDNLVPPIVRLIFALAIVYFLWGVVQYVLYPDEETKKKEGKEKIIWGLIALTVMFSVYALVSITTNTFLDGADNDVISVPQLPSN